ncbi:MAG: PIN domain-containing protein [Desulfurococcales archaeon]|nr:PIN domain-containing protein [Desulfurococcales archaeon]
MYYAGTYALIEILKGNPSYRKYSDIVTGYNSLLEVSYVLVRDLGVEKAREVIDAIARKIPVLTPTVEDYVKAGEILVGYDRELSPTDAMGYAMALNRGLKYLTGDSVFRDLDNVEWVE